MEDTPTQMIARELRENLDIMRRDLMLGEKALAILEGRENGNGGAPAPRRGRPPGSGKKTTGRAGTRRTTRGRGRTRVKSAAAA